MTGSQPDQGAVAVHRDGMGESVEVPVPTRRIVSLVPNLSEALALWGLADRLVAVTEYCVEPRDGFPAAERVRGTKNPDTARIVALAPDVVLANEEENRRLDVERLRQSGVAVYVTRVRTMADVAASMAGVGAVVGRREAGEDLAGRIADAVRAAPPRRVSAECAIWRDGAARGTEETWWLVGGDTYAGALLDASGLRAAARTGEERYPRVPLAALSAADPDVVLLPDEPYAFTEDDARAFSGWRTRVRHVSGTELFWWGPRTPAAVSRLRGLADDVARELAES